MKRLLLLLILMIPLISCSNKKAPTCDIMYINPYTSPYINWEEGDSILTSDMKSISDCFWDDKELVMARYDDQEIGFSSSLESSRSIIISGNNGKKLYLDFTGDSLKAVGDLNLNEAAIKFIEFVNQEYPKEIFKLNEDSSEITFNGIRYLRVPKNKIMYSNKELKYITQAMVEIQYRGWCKELCVEPTFDGFIAWKNKYNKY